MCTIADNITLKNLIEIFATEVLNKIKTQEVSNKEKLKNYISGIDKAVYGPNGSETGAFIIKACDFYNKKIDGQVDESKKRPVESNNNNSNIKKVKIDHKPENSSPASKSGTSPNGPVQKKPIKTADIEPKEQKQVKCGIPNCEACEIGKKMDKPECQYLCLNKQKYICHKCPYCIEPIRLYIRDSISDDHLKLYDLGIKNYSEFAASCRRKMEKNMKNHLPKCKKNPYYIEKEEEKKAYEEEEKHFSSLSDSSDDDDDDNEVDSESIVSDEDDDDDDEEDQKPKVQVKKEIVIDEDENEMAF